MTARHRRKIGGSTLSDSTLLMHRAGIFAIQFQSNYDDGKCTQLHKT